MRIEIENTSSPGASFTENTNNVLLATYDWIIEHPGTEISFRDFRKKLQSDKGINDNNNRNIYPLLKNGGLVEYEKGGTILVEHFFTKTGLAYVKSLDMIRVIESQDYSKDQIAKASIQFKSIQQEIIYNALLKVVHQPDVNYVEAFQDLIKILVEYERITKVEYAYFLYLKQHLNSNEAIKSMRDNLLKFRAGELDFDVQVKVRNDIEIRERTKEKKRNEGLSFLTSYGYFTSLLSQAGLAIKSDKYWVLNKSKAQEIKLLGGL